MTFLTILLLGTAIAAAIRPGRDTRTWARLGLGSAFIVAGLTHLVRPEPFEQHLPDWMVEGGRASIRWWMRLGRATPSTP